MNNIKNYKDLLLEEERISNEIEFSKNIIDSNVKSYLKPKNLFSFFESKIEKEVDQQFSGEFEFKKYLVSLSLDFLYEKVSDSLLTSSPEKQNGVDWKVIAKPLVDRVYINNKVMVADLVSDFIDENIKNIKKWTDK